MLLIYAHEELLNDGVREACYEKSTRLAHEISDRGQLLSVAPLHPSTTATTVRVRDGKRLITDGPFAETHEQLGGYFLVDVNDLDEALTIATQIPGAAWGSVEVRPVVELASL